MDIQSEPQLFKYTHRLQRQARTISKTYGGLQYLIDTIPRGDALIIMGDWNARTGDKAVQVAVEHMDWEIKMRLGNELLNFVKQTN